MQAGHGVLDRSPRRCTLAAMWTQAILAVLLGLGCGWKLAAQEPAPALDLRGTITYQERQTYVQLPIQVPPGVRRILVAFSYTGHEQHTNLDLGIFDSQRFRGWSGGNKHFFTISATDATPSYLPGAIVPGTWHLIIGVPNIEPAMRSQYEARVYFERDGTAAPTSSFSAVPLRNGPGWYRGDLHMHTAHSDGACLSQSGAKVPCPLYKTVEAAAARGLDFIAITDHNTVSQYDAMRELQPYFDRLLLIPGREITTFDGHGNVFGTTDFVDFRLGSKSVPSINDLLRAVQQKHAFFSINHPDEPTGAACMGCGWSAPGTDYRLVTAIEAINGGALDGPRSGIPFWQARLNEGYRLAGIGGSDNHDADLPQDAPDAVGHPTTVVYAENLSERAILDGARAGHVFIDIDGTRNRAITWSAQAGAATVQMGDDLLAPAGLTVHFRLQMKMLHGDHAEVICDGQSSGVLPGTAVAGDDVSQTFDYRSDGKRHWLRVNIRGGDRRLLIVGNPIYLNF